MKTYRQNKIIELINKFEIETQEELAEHLTKDGFQVTQATISRDIRELKLTKISMDDGRQKYIILSNPDIDMTGKYTRVLKEAFISMEKAQNIIVIKTVSGMAMAVAAAIDDLEISGVMGCIAGDDTIMCVIRTSEDTVSVMDKIKKLMSKEEN